MITLQLFVIALVQGITEFLPVSSSGHLMLISGVTGWPEQGLIIDVAVHVGTLVAVLVYFWREAWNMICGAWDLIHGRGGPRVRLLLFVTLGSLPLLAAGYAFHHYGWDNAVRGVEVVGWTTLVFGVFLYFGDRVGMTLRRMEHIVVADALVIGMAQILALVPGTSRSGITMTAARLMGFERREAARYSFLLAMPAIAGAGLLKGLQLIRTGDAQLTTAALTAAGLAMVVAFPAIALLMRWLERASFTPFAIYRVILGGAILYLVYVGI